MALIVSSISFSPHILLKFEFCIGLVYMYDVHCSVLVCHS